MPTPVARPKKSPAGPAAKPVPAPEFKYPELDVRKCVGPKALTEEGAKKLLGWVEETDKVKFGPDYLFEYKDENGKVKKVRCLNNTRNRPYNETWGETLAQEHLQLRWKVNGETIVIGRTGEILSGQHRLISLCLANAMRRRDIRHWEKNWPDPVTMECVLVFGVDEGDETVNTLDTGRPRSLGDVLYRSEFLAKFPPKDRKPMARMTDYAVRLLWNRTWAVKDAFAPERTHSEAIDFLRRHSRLMEAVSHVHQENDGNKVSKYMSPGYASALLYLMGTSASDVDEYVGNRDEAPSEKSLDFGRWDMATDFWTMLVGNSDELKEVRYALAALTDPDTGAVGSMDEKLAVFAKAWAAYVGASDGVVTKESLTLARSKPDGDGFRRLLEHPTFGGIDRGNPRLKDQDDPASSDPTLSETGDDDEADDESASVEERKRKVDAERENPKKNLTLGEQLKAELDGLRKDHAKCILMFKSKTTGDYTVWQPDAMPVALAAPSDPPLKVKRHTATDMMHCVVPKTMFEETANRLMEKGHRVGIVVDNKVHYVKPNDENPETGGPGTEDLPTEPKPSDEKKTETEPKPKAKKGAPKPVLRGGTN